MAHEWPALKLVKRLSDEDWRLIHGALLRRQRHPGEPSDTRKKALILAALIELALAEDFRAGAKVGSTDGESTGDEDAPYGVFSHLGDQ